jgi:hypothetical protein
LGSIPSPRAVVQNTAGPWYYCAAGIFDPALCLCTKQTQNHFSRTRVGGAAAPPGGRRRAASRRLYTVRTPRGWLGPARGEFLAPNSPLGPPPVLLADFWSTGAGRARNPLGFVRWVVPTEGQLACVFMSRTGRPSTMPRRELETEGGRGTNRERTTGFGGVRERGIDSAARGKLNMSSTF